MDKIKVGQQIYGMAGANGEGGRDWHVKDEAQAIGEK